MSIISMQRNVVAQYNTYSFIQSAIERAHSVIGTVIVYQIHTLHAYVYSAFMKDYEHISDILLWCTRTCTCLPNGNKSKNMRKTKKKKIERTGKKRNEQSMKSIENDDKRNDSGDDNKQRIRKVVNRSSSRYTKNEYVSLLLFSGCVFGISVLLFCRPSHSVGGAQMHFTVLHYGSHSKNST